MHSDQICCDLSPLDHIPPRNYVRTVFAFPLRPNVNQEAVFEDLVLSLRKTFVQESWASGKVFTQSLEPSAERRPGQLEIRYPLKYCSDDSQPRQISSHQLDTDWTYAKLLETGFPSGVFPEELLLLAAPAVGDVDATGAEVLLAQANFLPDGLLLAVSGLHAAMDGAGLLNLTRLWADNFRGLHNDAGKFRVFAAQPFQSADSDRSMPDRMWQLASSEHRQATDDETEDPWLRGLVGLDSDDADHIKIAAVHSSRPMLNRIFVLSDSACVRLLEECNAEPMPNGATALSIGDAITALLWRCLLRARVEAKTVADPEGVSILESPVDIRRSFVPGFPENYLGNCFLLNTTEMSVEELVSSSISLGRIAQALRESAARLDSQAVHSAYDLLQAADLSQVRGRFVERPTSADVLISNVMAFPVSSIDLGSQYFGNGGIPQALRVLHGPYAPCVRLSHILPRSERNQGIELSVNLFDDEMTHLYEDDEFTGFAMPIEPI